MREILDVGEKQLNVGDLRIELLVLHVHKVLDLVQSAGEFGPRRLLYRFQRGLRLVRERAQIVDPAASIVQLLLDRSNLVLRRTIVRYHRLQFIIKRRDLRMMRRCIEGRIRRLHTIIWLVSVCLFVCFLALLALPLRSVPHSYNNNN